MFKVFGAVRYFFLRLIQLRSPSVGYVGAPIYLRCAGRFRLGKKVRIFPGARIEIERLGELVIGDDTSMGQRAHLYAGNRIIIGKGCLLAENIFISDVDHTWEAPNRPIHHQPLKQADTVIGNNCFLGYGCVILAGTTLGEGVVVGANSVVRGDFPAGAIVAGNPATVIKKRRGYGG